ncbi:unnamed protein product [Allacma fusca]|uniref:BED-type domain-containing protein n=1 Tax=Allacma fusca TaxID=39272 RepID=A0A8J2JTX3_9HEXA|nr:unnamed protein product [Allacma fusca]
MSEEREQIVELVVIGDGPSSQLKSKKKSSDINNHYIFTDGVYKCKYCSTSVKKESNSGTRNRWTHLKSQHPIKCLPQIPKVGTQKGNIESAFERQKNGFDQEELNRLLARFVILTDQPFTVTETTSFIELMCHGRVKRPEIPNADSIKRRIVKLYENEKAKIIAKVKAAPGKVSLIADSWTSVHRKSFHGIIASWIDSDWNLQHVVLEMDILTKHAGT